MTDNTNPQELVTLQLKHPPEEMEKLYEEVVWWKQWVSDLKMPSLVIKSWDGRKSAFFYVIDDKGDIIDEVQFTPRMVERFNEVMRTLGIRK